MCAGPGSEPHNGIQSFGWQLCCHLGNLVSAGQNLHHGGSHQWRVHGGGLHRHSWAVLRGWHDLNIVHANHVSAGAVWQHHWANISGLHQLVRCGVRLPSWIVIAGPMPCRQVQRFRRCSSVQRGFYELCGPSGPGQPVLGNQWFSLASGVRLEPVLKRQCGSMLSSSMDRGDLLEDHHPSGAKHYVSGGASVHMVRVESRRAAAPQARASLSCRTLNRGST